ncbi:hypothetical protein CC86DRAFT_373746 [Ophiobolus disseminans]|uniref:Uncharacterized protein n=1 Tax=Ophiobolus disseminans TaxID=1469910 RepID=A0A6A6ZJZ1_9PLEO|nr:hypothetical protein CC86DRAFT_373746 [Ophiobolus disseminans]
MLFPMSFATLLSIFSLTTSIIASPPSSPQHNIFERQASECVARLDAIACPGGQYCCPRLWECKANDPSICTASIGPGQALTVSAIDWGAAMASASRELDPIRSKASEILASVTRRATSSVNPGRVTVTSLPTLSSSVVNEVGPASSASGPGGASTLAIPTLQSTPSVASVTAAIASATGGAIGPKARTDLVMGGVIGMGLFLV